MFLFLDHLCRTPGLLRGNKVGGVDNGSPLKMRKGLGQLALSTESLSRMHMFRGRMETHAHIGS